MSNGWKGGLDTFFDMCEVKEQIQFHVESRQSILLDVLLRLGAHMDSEISRIVGKVAGKEDRNAAAMLM